MKWILRVISPEGDKFYSEPRDVNGNRRLCRNAQFAEQFDNLSAAESGMSYFHLLWEFRACVVHILEKGSSDSFGITGMANQRSAETQAPC